MDTQHQGSEPVHVEDMLARIRQQHGGKRCPRINPILHVNRYGQQVADCQTCGQPLEQTTKRAVFYRHVPEARLP